MAITTCPVRVSYPTIFTPKAVVPGQEPKYGIVLMIEKTNKEHLATLKALHTEAQEVFTAKWPDPAKGPRVPLAGHDKSPIKDGDKAVNASGIPLAERNPEYAGCFIVRAGSLNRPAVVDRNMQEIINAQAVYAGCLCKVNINAYAYDTAGNKGVTFGLNGVQFWADGERIGGGAPSVDKMFEADNGSDEIEAYEGGNPFS